MLKVEDVVKANILAVGRERMMPVFGRLNDRGVESYEVEVELSKIKVGKQQG